MPDPGAQTFSVDSTGFRAEPESDFRGVLISLLGQVFAVRLGSTTRRESLEDLQDAIFPYEDEAFQKAVQDLNAQRPSWKKETTWERHYQRSMIRAIRSLMFRAGFDGDLSASDYQEDL
jgi:hypothetical protein